MNILQIWKWCEYFTDWSRNDVNILQRQQGLESDEEEEDGATAPKTGAPGELPPSGSESSSEEDSDDEVKVHHKIIFLPWPFVNSKWNSFVSNFIEQVQ